MNYYQAMIALISICTFPTPALHIDDQSVRKELEASINRYSEAYRKNQGLPVLFLRDRLTLIYPFKKYARCFSEIGIFKNSMTLSMSSQTSRFTLFTFGRSK